MYLFTMQVAITTKRHFPELLELHCLVSNHHKRPVHKVEELLMPVVGMFLFKRGSHNHAINSAAKGNYLHNFERLFGCRQPDLDTSNNRLKEMGSEELEEVKRMMVQLL